jgi:hypothetical protein
MIQGGDPSGTGSGYRIRFQDEFTDLSLTKWYFGYGQLWSSYNSSQ